jgi:hypothetical protein
MRLEIEIPENKEKEVKGVLKALGVKIISNKKDLNQETTKTTADGKGSKSKKEDQINAYLNNF